MLRRGPQWDMFDVASGACSLEDYLEQRYSENDLNSTFWIEASDKLEPIHPPNYQPPPPPAPVSEPGHEVEAQAEAEAPSLDDLVARFHQQAKEYEDRAQDSSQSSEE